MEAAMFSRTFAFGVAMSTLAAAASATAQVQQASPQQASPRQATPIANIPPTSSAGTAGTSFRVQGQTPQGRPQNDVNGTTVEPGIIAASPSPGGVTQSGGAGSVSRTPLLAPVQRPEIRVR